MYETQIRNALKTAGLDEGLINRIKVRQEDDIAGAVTKLKEETALFDGLEKAGLRELFEKYLQSETDRRISKALATHDEKLSQEKEAQEDRLMVSGDAERMNSDSPGTTYDQNAITNLKSLVQTLIEKVAHIEQGAATQRCELLARKALKEAGLPESMTRYISLDDESRIMDQVETLKKEILDIRQAENDGKLLDSTIPSIGGNTGTLGEDAALQFAQSLNTGDSEIGIISEQV